MNFGRFSEAAREDIINETAKLWTWGVTNGALFLYDDLEQMVKAIQVLRIHLLELEKVSDLCKDFCSRYIACLKTKMNSETLLSSTDPASPYSPTQAQVHTHFHSHTELVPHVLSTYITYRLYIYDNVSFCVARCNHVIIYKKEIWLINIDNRSIFFLPFLYICFWTSNKLLPQLLSLACLFKRQIMKHTHGRNVLCCNCSLPHTRQIPNDPFNVKAYNYSLRCLKAFLCVRVRVCSPRLRALLLGL